MPVRTLLADDHTLVRAGLRKLLELMPGIEVVGEAEDGLALLALAEQLQPRLVLMDISMPGLNGLEATAQLVKAMPGVRVVILSMHQNEELCARPCATARWATCSRTLRRWNWSWRSWPCCVVIIFSVQRCPGAC